MLVLHREYSRDMFARDCEALRTSIPHLEPLGSKQNWSMPSEEEHHRAVVNEIIDYVRVWWRRCEPHGAQELTLERA